VNVPEKIKMTPATRLLAPARLAYKTKVRWERIVYKVMMVK